ncbi:MAG TPA: glycosyltransferase family 4 protein [Deltaproteobacteria bacterium]|nr:glycosyltransferase family 4 protein [Deltaproteobacteria bacterium]
MKILHLSTYDTAGGAARAAYRLHRSLLQLGAESEMLVQDRQGDDITVYGPQSSWRKFLGRFINPRLDTLPLKIYRNEKNTPFHIQALPTRIIRKIHSMNPDIVHLHWICDGFIRIEDFPLINRPLVWTLHDSWPFTGGCHIPIDCFRYEDTCGNCPQLGSQKEYDLSRWIWKRKQKSYKGAVITVVSPSRWLADCAAKSSLFESTTIKVIRNGIDVDWYTPIAKNVARKVMNLPPDKYLILFGANNATADFNKGFHLIPPAIAHMKSLFCQQEKVELIVFGSSRPAYYDDLGVETRFLGRLHDDISLKILYSAADVTLVPSRLESSSNVIMESMACGTPCVAFDIGGPRDLIDHEKNGYLAKPYETAELGKGLAWILSDNKRYTQCAQKARSDAEKNFDIKKSAQSHLELYTELTKL